MGERVATFGSFVYAVTKSAATALGRGDRRIVRADRPRMRHRRDFLAGLALEQHRAKRLELTPRIERSEVGPKHEARRAQTLVRTRGAKRSIPLKALRLEADALMIPRVD